MNEKNYIPAFAMLFTQTNKILVAVNRKKDRWGGGNKVSTKGVLDIARVQEIIWNKSLDSSCNIDKVIKLWKSNLEASHFQKITKNKQNRKLNFFDTGSSQFNTARNSGLFNVFNTKYLWLYSRIETCSSLLQVHGIKSYQIFF